MSEDNRRTNESEEQKLAKQKAAAAARAKAEALRKQKEKEESSDAETLAKQKAAAAARAKAEALRKQKEKEESSDAETLAKQKAAAAARAKAEALRKQKEKEESSDPETLAKQKAAAAARAKAEALRKQKGEKSQDVDEAKKKAIAAAKAKAAAAAKAKALREKQETTPEEKKPSPNEPLLQKYKKVIEESIGLEGIEDSYINTLSKDVPTFVVAKNDYLRVTELFHQHEQLKFEYLSELHGTDFETHMEVYLHLYSFTHGQKVVLVVKLDRDQPVLPSVVHLWKGANWPEREAFDLLGITFTGHPELKRIVLPDDWVGHPLRKDYEPYDVEV